MGLDLAPRRFVPWLAAAGVACLLVGCGGAEGQPPPPSTTVPAVTVMQPGFFADAVASVPNYPETVAMFSSNRWWAVRRDGANSASLFSGVLSQDGLGAGSIASIQAFAGGWVRTGSASMSSVSAQGLSGRISLVADASATPPLSAMSVDVTVSKPGSAIYSASTTADVSQLNGDWTGIWIDGASSALTTLKFNSGALSLPSSSTVLNCRLTNASGVIAEAGAHLFRIDLAFQPGVTTCSRSDQLVVRIFSGVLAVYTLPDQRQRLDFVAVDAAGSGIVFRAER